MFRVNAYIQDELLKLPESGMGYQIVEATLRNSIKREAIIFNATIVEEVEGDNVRQLYKSFSEGKYEDLTRNASVSNEIISVRLIEDRGLFKSSFHEDSSKYLIEAKDAPLDSTLYGEHFVRFSHYYDDKRVDRINWKFLPGTYATTSQDAEYCIKNHIDPIARYALPSNLTVKYAFDAYPSIGTKIKRGTVKPANNQPGGGKEVVFPQGTNDNSVSKNIRTI